MTTATGSTLLEATCPRCGRTREIRRADLFAGTWRLQCPCRAGCPSCGGATERPGQPCDRCVAAVQAPDDPADDPEEDQS